MPNVVSLEAEIDQHLASMVQDLDGAIARAIENPLSFAEQPLDTLSASCAALLKLNEQSLVEKCSEPREELIWQVRARAGRLQMLLDAATRFYSSCFSAFEPSCLDYSAQGGWSESSHSSHLLFDC